MMKLSVLLKPWMTSIVADCEIVGLHNDSRHIMPGYLFLAYPGASVDGRDYLSQAILAGAIAIIYDPDGFDAEALPKHLPCIPLEKLASKLASIAARFYDEPGRELNFTAVTGTNGKTTIAYQLAQAHDLLGESAAYIGTIGQGQVRSLQPLDNTTPDALCLQRLFYDYKQHGINQVCMEVSSHALCQHRVDHIDFTQAIFTNLSHEHLDYHQTMQAYAKAKATLFAIPSLKWAIVNLDDAYSQNMLSKCVKGCQKLTYGFHKDCDVRAINCQISMTGSTFDVVSPWGTHHVQVKTLGTFNVYNSLAVLASLFAYGYSPSRVIEVMAQLQASPGRMDVVAKRPCVIVDYAHTPDALENVLSTLQQLKKGRIWVVFGCGGDRDKTKRPMMGRIASQFADVVMITSDNPRSEDPSSIMDEIATGLLPNTEVLKQVDRTAAIHQVLSLAANNDIVLIAGKGHEAYQQIGQQRFAFSDQDVVHEYLHRETTVLK